MTILPHLPALVVVTPLMAAPVIVMLRNRTAAFAIALTVSWLCLAMSLMLLGRVLDSGPFSYLLGGWAAPWGIEYRIDALAGFVMVVVSAIASVVATYARASVNHEIPAERHYLFYAMYVLCLCGLLGMTITGDAFNVFVFLEIASLSTYVLVSLGSDRRALMAAFRYLVVGTIGATFYVIGIGLLYAMTGTLNMADLAVRLPAVAQTTTVHAGLAFITVGLLIKMAAFPLHMWLPNGYAYAPSVSTAFLAGTATKVSVYVFLRLFFGVFGGTGVFTALPLADILMAMALVGMFVGSAVAIWQPNLKRALAYSSVAQIGYILLGISMLSATGLAAGIVHLFNHAIMKSSLFLVLGAVILRTGAVRLDDLAGIGRHMPLTMAAFLVGGLSLIGVPATVGFVSKWYLIEAALEQGHWVIAGLILASSLLAVLYIWRIVEVAWFDKPTAQVLAATEAPWSLLLPIWLLVGATLWFGINATGTMSVARAAAAVLLGGSP